MGWKRIEDELGRHPRAFLVTGAAGFIGSHLVEHLLRLGAEVRALDDFSTGRSSNLEGVQRSVGAAAWKRFELVEGDIRNPQVCARACEGAPLVLHQAALGSVPRSIADPATSLAVNVDGFLNVILAARDAGCERVVYASSSSVYGDHPGLPKREDQIGEPLSPYAASKRTNEIYAGVFQRTYGIELVGLRYFNVFGPRQDPDGPYAAVIPRWILALLSGQHPVIYGDGETSRDFCPVRNIVQANLLAALVPSASPGTVYNVALGGQHSLNELCAALRQGLGERGVPVETLTPSYEDFRAGDVRHSLADVTQAERELGYAPDVGFVEGIELTLDWFLEQHRTA